MVNEWESGIASSYNKIYRHRNKSKKIGPGAKGEGREKLYLKQKLREGIVNEQKPVHNFLKANVKTEAW